MRRFLIVFFLILILSTTVTAEMLIPGGQTVGLQLRDGTVTVVGFGDDRGKVAGLQKGDRILKVNGITIACAEDVKNALVNAGNSVEVTVERGGREKIFTVETVENSLGLYLRQGTAGLGTVTYYDPKSGSFGALGHGVNDQKGGLLVCGQGDVFAAQVASVKKGEKGKPGLLVGSLQGEKAIGILEKNVIQGVFGKLPAPKDEPLPTGKAQVGKATIRSTVGAEGMREYQVEILQVYPGAERTRNLLLRITDEALLAATGGIVQGMSGSPIIQDGKLVGAVTHVLVNDPTRGYGIFIENMLEAAA